MKKLGKRTLALFIALLMCVSLMPVTASALSDYMDTNLECTVSFIATCSHKPKVHFTIPAKWGEGTNTCQTTSSYSVTGSPTTKWTVTYTVKCTSGSYNGTMLTKTATFTCADYNFSGKTGSKSLQITFKNTYSNNNQTQNFYLGSSKVPKVHTHSYDNGIITTQPTCYSDGVKTYTCSGCNASTTGHTKTETISASTEYHTWKDWQKYDTNQHIRWCNYDKHSEKANHTYGEWETTKEPQVGVPGEKQHTCTACGHKETEPIDALPAKPEDPVPTKAGMFQLDISKEISNYENYSGKDVKLEDLPETFKIDVTVEYFDGTDRVSETKTLTKNDLTKTEIWQDPYTGYGCLLVWENAFQLPDWQFDFAGTGKTADDLAAYNNVVTFTESNYDVAGYTCEVNSMFELSDTNTLTGSTNVTTHKVQQSGSKWTQHRDGLSNTYKAPVPEKVTITYKDGEDVIGTSDTPEKGTEYEVKGLPDTVTPPDGKEFDKWQGSDGKEYHPGDKITPEDDLTLTVVWKDETPGPEEPETVTVTFIDGYDGSLIGEKITNWVKGESVPEDRYPTRPTHDDKDPNGWTVEVDPGTGDITITAQWKDKEQPVIPDNPNPPTPVNPTPVDPTPPTPTTRYTVNWEDGSGNVIKTTTTTSTDVPDSLYPADPEREGESFTGWGEPEISGTVITIVAQWEEEIVGPDVPLIVAPGLDAVNHFAYIIGYGDGTVRPGRNITRAEVATIFYRLMTDDYRGTFWSQNNEFTDVNSGDWFNNAVSTSAEAELVKGYADGTFKGKNNITRAEFATIAARFLSDDPTGENPFTDTQGHWAEKDILKAYEAGWINGYADGTFKPNAKITRAEVMTIVNRMLNRVPHAEDLLDGEMTTYPDNQPGAWYYAAVQEATNSHDYERGERDGETVETWTAMKANRDWAALEKEWSNAYSGSTGNDIM